MLTAHRTKTAHSLFLSAALSMSLAPAAAQTARVCPVDGVQRLTAPAAAPWNAAAGVDTDGCQYSVDELGRRRAIGLNQIVQCTRCRVSFLPTQLGVVLEEPERAKLSADALSAERAGANRWEIAALTCELLGQRGLEPGQDPEALLGEVYLRAAWTARSDAVTSGADGGYRPRTLEEARAQLEDLERLANLDPRKDPEVLRIDRLLGDLEHTRLGLPEGPLNPVARRRLLGSQAHLASMERRLLERKALALSKAGGQVSGLDQGELLEALTRAWLRFGEPSGWRPLLERIEERGGRSARLRNLRRAAASEGRLLGLAVLHFRIAAQEPSVPAAEKARLHYLIGDGLRRQGERGEAVRHFRLAAQLDPEGEPARWANALLAGD